MDSALHPDLKQEQEKEIISFFGASVTEQKSGYASILKYKYFKDEKVYIHGFGSCHIIDAGVCKIPNVLQDKPNYCLMDWFTTGWISIDDDRTINSLNFIIKQFSENNCKIVFLFLIRKDHEERIEFYEFIKSYLRKLDICYIDLNEDYKYSDIIIRDTVHTTDEGSNFYAKVIFEKFNKIKTKLKIPDIKIISKYSNIKSFSVNKIFYKKIKFNGNAQILFFELHVGPNSSAIKFDDCDTSIKIWDQWCYYDRTTIVRIDHTNENGSKKYKIIKGELSCSILDDIDTSSCTKGVNYDDYEKYLHIKKVYYIGEDLKIIE